MNYAYSANGNTVSKNDNGVMNYVYKAVITGCGASLANKSPQFSPGVFVMTPSNGLPQVRR